jgi:hypothetical protein
MKMTMAETHNAPAYDDDGARKALAKTIKAHQAKLAELSDLRAFIEQAEGKLAGMQEAIEKSAAAEDAVAELAANALRAGKDISERSPAWRAKVQRDELIAEHKLLTVGFTRLQSQANGLEREVASAHDAVVEAREPVVQDMLTHLAEELAAKETEAASLRAKLYGFSVCSKGPNCRSCQRSRSLC